MSGLAGQDPALARAVASFAWVIDGITEQEREALVLIEAFGIEDSGLAGSVADLPWVADGITADEPKALQNLYSLASDDISVAQALAGFPWIRDDITGSDEWGPLAYVAAITKVDVSLGTTVAGFPWLLGGVTEEQRGALYYLWKLSGLSVPLAGSVAAFTWVSDDITGEEWSALYDLHRLATLDLATGIDVAAFPWLSQVMTGRGFQSLQLLRLLGDGDKSLSGELAGMPFLNGALGARDESALSSLYYLARIPGDLSLLREQGWYQDGIDDREAALVTVLYRQSQIAPEEFRGLLAFHEYQASSIVLPLAGEVRLTILRQSAEQALKAQGQMARLEAAMRHIEEFMGLPFPQDDIILLYGETGSRTTGVYLGSHIVVDRPVAIQGDLRRVEAHEVGHYYWNSGNGVPLWFYEGGTEFLTSYVIAQEYGETLQSRLATVGGGDARRCEATSMGTIQRLVDNLALIGYEEQQQRSYFTCNYNLGEALFLDLYQTLGPEAFRTVWRQVYGAGESGHEHTEEAIHQIFLDQASAGIGREFAQVYSLWHGGDFPG